MWAKQWILQRYFSCGHIANKIQNAMNHCRVGNIAFVCWKICRERGNAYCNLNISYSFQQYTESLSLYGSSCVLFFLLLFSFHFSFYNLTNTFNFDYKFFVWKSSFWREKVCLIAEVIVFPLLCVLPFFRRLCFFRCCFCFFSLSLECMYFLWKFHYVELFVLVSTVFRLTKHF